MAAFSIITRAQGCPTTRMLKEGSTDSKRGRKHSQTDGAENTVVEVGCDMIFLQFFHGFVCVCCFGVF